MKTTKVLGGIAIVSAIAFTTAWISNETRMENARKEMWEDIINSKKLQQDTIVDSIKIHGQMQKNYFEADSNLIKKY